jgi:hypothetical protein
MILESRSVVAATVIVALQRWLDTLANGGLDAQGNIGIRIGIFVCRQNGHTHPKMPVGILSKTVNCSSAMFFTIPCLMR